MKMLDTCGHAIGRLKKFLQGSDILKIIKFRLRHPSLGSGSGLIVSKRTMLKTITYLESIDKTTAPKYNCSLIRTRSSEGKLSLKNDNF